MGSRHLPTFSQWRLVATCRIGPGPPPIPKEGGGALGQLPRDDGVSLLESLWLLLVEIPSLLKRPTSPRGGGGAGGSLQRDLPASRHCPALTHSVWVTPPPSKEGRKGGGGLHKHSGRWARIPRPTGLFLARHGGVFEAHGGDFPRPESQLSIGSPLSPRRGGGHQSPSRPTQF